MNLREFVKTAVRPYVVDRDADCDVVSYERDVLVHLTNSPFVAIVYPDRSAQLLSRDEDECLLFQMLWELEK